MQHLHIRLRNASCVHAGDVSSHQGGADDHQRRRVPRHRRWVSIADCLSAAVDRQCLSTKRVRNPACGAACTACRKTRYIYFTTLRGARVRAILKPIPGITAQERLPPATVFPSVFCQPEEEVRLNFKLHTNSLFMAHTYVTLTHMFHTLSQNDDDAPGAIPLAQALGFDDAGLVELYKKAMKSRSTAKRRALQQQLDLIPRVSVGAGQQQQEQQQEHSLAASALQIADQMRQEAGLPWGCFEHMPCAVTLP